MIMWSKTECITKVSFDTWKMTQATLTYFSMAIKTNKLIHFMWTYLCLLLFIGLYKIALVAMDTTRLYNQHILWQ